MAEETKEKVPVSAEELGESAYSIVSAGISDTSEALSVLESSSKLAVAGLGTAAEATDIMTSAINAFQIEASQADVVADSLFTAVKNGKTTVTPLSDEEKRKGIGGKVQPSKVEQHIHIGNVDANNPSELNKMNRKFYRASKQALAGVGG